MSCCAPGTEGDLEAEACGLPMDEEIRASSRAVGEGVLQTDLSVPGVYCGACIAKVEKALGEAETVKTVWKPQTMAPVDEDKAESVLKLIDRLEDDDDVQNVYANFEVDEATLAKLSAA